MSKRKDNQHADGEMQIVYRKLDTIKPLPGNAKLHDLPGIIKGISDHGFVDPILVSIRTMHNLDGNGRWEALTQMHAEGRTAPAGVIASNGHWLVPTLDKDCDEQTERILALSLNRLNERGGYDIQAVLAILSEASEIGRLEQTGYDSDALAGILTQCAELNHGNGSALIAGEQSDAEPQIDRAEELNKKWKVKTGDLWLIGEHRLLCGDSTNAGDVARVMGGKKAEMMFTDPPYGVNYKGGHFHSGDVNIKREREELEGDHSTEIYAGFLPVALAAVDGPCYMWFADSKARDVYNAVFGAGCELHALIIWHKTNATYAAMNAQYKQRHEPCLYFKPKGSTLRWCGATTEATLWSEDRDGINEFHPTQKPIALATKAIGNHEAEIIADFFGGSGSTMVAAQNLGRKCYMLEISPNYCAVILERISSAFPYLVISKTQ